MFLAIISVGSVKKSLINIKQSSEAENLLAVILALQYVKFKQSRDNQVQRTTALHNYSYIALSCSSFLPDFT